MYMCAYSKELIKYYSLTQSEQTFRERVVGFMCFAQIKLIRLFDLSAFLILSEFVFAFFTAVVLYMR